MVIQHEGKKMNTQRCFCFIVVMIVFNFSSAYSQDLTKRFGLSGFGAAVKMIGGQTDRSTIDQWAGIRIKYGYTPTLAFDVNLGYGWVYARDPQGSQFEGIGGYKTLLFPFNANLIIHLFPYIKQRPFISFGVGVTQWDIREIPDNATTFSIGESVNGSQLNMTVLSGFGFEFFLSDNITADLCFKYHRLLKGNEDTIGFGDDANDGIIELRLAFAYFFSGFKDSDGDGIEDKYDLAKYDPEDFDNFQDQDGIPDPDNDLDGIPDILDKASNDAEDFDGFEDEDGVPDPDNDNDGIIDAADSCLNVPEDHDGFEDNNGCPEYDNDNDTIPDSIDQCPNWPEDFNDYMDHDGCPDEKPEPPPYQKGETVLLKGINFASNSAELTTQSYAVLEEQIKILQNYPELEIEIRGYTDSIGDWYYNQLLSEQRAHAVKRYLISRGIDSSRIRAVGYGERNPIAPNTSKAGRAANRRIEFVRIK